MARNSLENFGVRSQERAFLILVLTSRTEVHMPVDVSDVDNPV